MERRTCEWRVRHYGRLVGAALGAALAAAAYAEGRWTEEDFSNKARLTKPYVVIPGRDPAKIGIEGRIHYANTTPDDWLRDLAAWKELGASHVGLSTMRAGLRTPQDHIDAIRRFQEAIKGAV